MTTWYLGLSTSGHDPALAIADEAGQIRFAEATERFVQDKRAWGIAPDHVTHLEHALKACGADPERDRFVVATSWKAVKASLDIVVHDAMLPASDTIWMRGLQAGLQASAGANLLRLGVEDGRRETLHFDHHHCHAAATAYFAPVDDAVCLVLDGEGEVGAASLFSMSSRELKRKWRGWGPGSLGTFYAWLTFHCGFDWRLGEEWKVMGLAAYGSILPELQGEMTRLLLVDHGRLKFADNETIAAIDALTRAHARMPAEPIMKAADLAATGQAVYAALADRVIADVREDGVPDLLLTGGCALNSSYNGTIAGRLGFERVHIAPCPADDGNAIGAALLAFMQDRGVAGVPASPDASPFLGTVPDRAIERKMAHAANGLSVTDVSGRSAAAVAGRLAEGRVIGVMRGPAEFGPRALGHRSILADPTRPEIKDRINAEIKGREPYRPLAPVVLEAEVGDWFERPQPSPYMSITLPWRSTVQVRVPSVVHADGTGRLQTVSPDSQPWMSALLDSLRQTTGVPVALNTSLNVMGKPIAHSVEDALAILATTGLDGVLCEDYLVEKP
ncbi:carbamoyltransferase [Breoghania corrubedonensis]|uniref:Carbamoyltransferase n=1 Tax=Breoghania corrubedonensis TaxID=665038 RepID=A0A2T5VFQ2_9HYPH|nr:carbamoyltransferase C-terminal domain-containing protein [Breoghania corrubedonensis]PTW62587.1 carbamoyltransferase [Breoghania corrubedonensis]